MSTGAHFLIDLVVVLGVAAVTTVVFQRLRQPVVLGYVLAGLIIGPYVPIPLVGNVKLVTTLSELGVILLMFSIGLEFSIRKIARIGASAALTALIEVGLMVAIGYLGGHLLGWSSRESLFAGACLGISSTMLVAKTFAERGIKDGFTELVFAILVFEDLIAILLLAILTAVASGRGLSPADLGVTVGKLIGFFLAMLAAGLLVVPRFIRAIVKLDRAETLLVASMAVCFGMASIAQEVGYSVALGAFLGGMLVAESGMGAKVEHTIGPFRDLFAAVFFVSVGMTIDPALIAKHWLPILVLSVLVVFGKLFGVSMGAFLTGNGLRRSVRAGLSLGQIGEFSFIIAGLGIAKKATGDFLLPVAVAVSCITAFLTPWLVRGSDRIAATVDARLPARVQTFVSLYSSWVEGIRSSSAAPRRVTLGSRIRRPLLLLIIDTVALCATVVGAAVGYDSLVWALRERLGLAHLLAEAIVVGIAAVITLVFLVGAIRVAQKLARELAAQVLPPSEDGKLDLGTAPRRALVVTLQLAIVLVVGLPVLALLQPFVVGSGIVFAVVLVVAAISAWRSISNLQGHVRAGSELIIEALARQTGGEAELEHEIDRVKQMLPGMSGLSPVRLDPGSPAIGRSLGELNLRALTGATVLAIARRDHGTVLPTAQEQLKEGDVLALAGSLDAVEAARQILRSADH